MKKLIPLILAAALTLAACASASDETPLTTPTPAPEAPEPFFSNDTATTEIYPHSLHAALPIGGAAQKYLSPGGVTAGALWLTGRSGRCA